MIVVTRLSQKRMNTLYPALKILISLGWEFEENNGVIDLQTNSLDR